MESLFMTIRFVIGSGVFLLVALVALAHLPQSPLRSVLMQICGWGMAAVCGAYALSPIDVIPEAFLGPFGLVDDLAAVVLGIISAMGAIESGKERAEFKAAAKKERERQAA